MTIRVLVADDQGMVRSGFSILLNAQPDIEVVGEAVNGQEAITRAAELGPDVILMDVRMPVLDGLQATRALRADPRTARLPVLGVTGRVFDEDIRECLDAVFAAIPDCIQLIGGPAIETNENYVKPCKPH